MTKKRRLMMTKREEIILILLELVELWEDKEHYKELTIEENEIKLMIKEELENLTNFDFNYSQEDMVKYDKLLSSYKNAIIQLKKEKEETLEAAKEFNKEFDRQMEENKSEFDSGWTTTITGRDGKKRIATDEEKVAIGKSLLRDKPPTQNEDWIDSFKMYERKFKKYIIKHKDNEEIYNKLNDISKSGILKILKDEIIILELKKIEATEAEAERFDNYCKEFGDLSMIAFKQERIDKKILLDKGVKK
jgi:hypothetical protein